MIGCLRTHVRKQLIIALYFESENELKFYNLKARSASKLFDTLTVLQKYLFEETDFEENIRRQKNMKNFPAGKELNKQVCQ